MSDAASNAREKNAIQQPLPAWLASGILGLALGSGGAFLGLHYYGYSAEGPPQQGPPPGMAPAGMGAGMAPGGMGGGGMGGGGGAPARGKRNLTALVGKLDLISEGLSLELNGEQSAKLAAQLATLDQPDNMTQEEAQDRLDALETVLTEEQKDILAQFEMPRAGRAGGGGMGGGPPGGGMGGGGMGGGPPGGGGATDDSNPFQEEANQERLHSLVNRLQGAGTPQTPASE